MDSDVNERFKYIENRLDNHDDRLNKNDDKIDKIIDKQNKDHDELISIKKDTTYIKEVVEQVKDKWDSWDKNNFNQLDKLKWSVIGIFTSLAAGIMLAVILHFLHLK